MKENWVEGEAHFERLGCARNSFSKASNCSAWALSAAILCCSSSCLMTLTNWNGTGLVHVFGSGFGGTCAYAQIWASMYIDCQEYNQAWRYAGFLLMWSKNVSPWGSRWCKAEVVLSEFALPPPSVPFQFALESFSSSSPDLGPVHNTPNLEILKPSRTYWHLSVF